MTRLSKTLSCSALKLTTLLTTISRLFLLARLPSEVLLFRETWLSDDNDMMICSSAYLLAVFSLKRADDRRRRFATTVETERWTFGAADCTFSPALFFLFGTVKLDLISRNGRGSMKGTVVSFEVPGIASHNKDGLLGCDRTSINLRTRIRFGIVKIGSHILNIGRQHISPP